MMLALLHDGLALAPHDVWRAWSAEPGIVVPLAIAGAMYAVGVRRLWRSAGTDGGIRRWEAASFAGGWLVLAIALVSPLHALGGSLFLAHMLQHELLMVVAAPLLVLGRPLVPLLWALPESWRRSLGGAARSRAVRRPWRALTDPLAAWSLQTLVLWGWHAPALFEASLHSDAVHALQHASFLGASLLFWWALVHGRRGRMGYGAAVLYLFTTAVHSSVLGALLTFAPTPWYAHYAATAPLWGFSALEDQQFAGLIMWVPAGISYLIAALALLVSWMRESERRVVRREETRV
jgi:putative membrane protein